MKLCSEAMRAHIVWLHNSELWAGLRRLGWFLTTWSRTSGCPTAQWWERSSSARGLRGVPWGGPRPGREPPPRTAPATTRLGGNSEHRPLSPRQRNLERIPEKSKMYTLLIPGRNINWDKCTYVAFCNVEPHKTSHFWLSQSHLGFCVNLTRSLMNCSLKTCCVHFAFTTFIIWIDSIQL